jgi:hypothetical protein
MGVTTDTSQFKKGLDTASDQLSKFKGAILGAVGAFASFEAAKGVFESIKGSIEAVAQTRILAERIGMGAEAFGKLGYAARLAHVDQDSLAMSLGQMNKRLAEVAIEGSGPAADALKRFGLSARGLTQMGTEQAFGKLVGVLASIQNPMERANVAMDLFGKSGQGVINIAAMGAGKLAELGLDAGRLGIALNAIDAAKVEEADQAMIRLSAAGAGFYNLLAVQVAPIMTELIDRYLEWGYAGTKSNSFVSRSMEWVVKGVGFAIDAVNVLKTAFHSVESTMAQMVSYLLSGVEAIVKGFAYLFEKITGSKLELSNTLADLATAFQKVAVAELDAADAAWKNVGAGQAVAHNLVDDIQKGAFDRAKGAAEKAKDFSAPGAFHSEKEAGDKKFGGALELGSKEAYSSVLRSRGMAQGDDGKKTARNTAKTAEGVANLARIFQAGRGVPGRKPRMPGAF